MEFFWGTVVVGFLKWIFAVLKDEVSTLDTVALIYSIVLFIVLCFYPPKTKEETIPINNEIYINKDLQKIREGHKKWKESVGTGILSDSI